MKDLTILLRCMQLYTHNCHNLISGATFFEDHEFLGGLYGTYEGLYDSIVERMIGLGELDSKQLLDIQVKSMDILKQIDSNMEVETIFSNILTCEKEIQNICSKIKGSLGTMNLIAQIADDSEVRSYKLQQKLK